MKQADDFQEGEGIEVSARLIGTAMRDGLGRELVNLRGLLETLVAAGSGVAKFNLATACLHGAGGEVDAVRARALYAEVVGEEGCPVEVRRTAAGRFGLLLVQGIGGNADVSAGLVKLEEAATMGSAEAAFNAGLLLDPGAMNPWVTADGERSASFYRFSASLGCKEAACNLGVALARGVAREAEPGEAMRWLSLAAAGGDVRAGYALEVLRRAADEEGVNRLYRH